MKHILVLCWCVLAFITIQANATSLTVKENYIVAPTNSSCEWVLNGTILNDYTNNKLPVKESGIYQVTYLNDKGISVKEQLLVVVNQSGKVVTIRLIGDSTVATYEASKHPLTGWGQVFQEIMHSDSLQKIKYVMDADSAVVVNYARGGRSTRTFYEEGLWDEVYNAIQPSDFVLMQFGHNDASLDHPDRYVDTAGYKDFLELFVNQTREKGGTPVLITPVNRNYPWRDGALNSVHGDYPFAMKQVAEKLHVPLIDLTQRSLDFFTSKGQSYVSDNYFMNLPAGEYEAYPNGESDNTHFQVAGAKEVAYLVYQGLKDLRNVDITVSPDSAGTAVGSKWYETAYNTSVVLSAQPEVGYVFEKWSGDVVSTENPLTIQLDSNISVKAHFIETTKPQYYIHEGASEGGAIQISPAGNLYVQGEQLMLNGIPDDGFKFYSWYGDLHDTANPAQFTVTEEATVNAFFTESLSTILEDDQANYSSCSLDSVVNNYTGTSYSIAGNATNDSLVWIVYPATSETYKLYWRYTGSVEENATGQLYVNGKLVKSSLNFLAVDSLPNWTYTTNFRQKMDPGKNEIKVVMKEGSIPVFIDHIKVFGGELLGTPTAIQQPKYKTNQVSLYPNPCTTELKVRLTIENKTSVMVTVFSMQGAKVATLFQDTLQKGEQELLLNTDSLNPGNYMLRITSNQFTSSHKIMVD